ncbi:hypothetical protein RhiirB3_380394 [Rhizophagus irregularis]|nr:hypothetical protein RhiirB3_380394 [Rhizophagus irregularis]
MRDVCEKRYDACENWRYLRWKIHVDYMIFEIKHEVRLLDLEFREMVTMINKLVFKSGHKIYYFTSRFRLPGFFEILDFGFPGSLGYWISAFRVLLDSFFTGIGKLSFLYPETIGSVALIQLLILFLKFVYRFANTLELMANALGINDKCFGINDKWFIFNAKCFVL